jgi:hypothetical protein
MAEETMDKQRLSNAQKEMTVERINNTLHKG